MAKGRMISKSISVSRRLAQVTPFEALLFTWLVPHCDDGGNMAGDAFTVKGLVMPVRPETVQEVEQALKNLVNIGLLEGYEVGGEPFLHVKNWENHQSLRKDRATWQYPRWQPDGNQVATTRQPRAAEGKVREDKVREDNNTFPLFWAAYPKKVSKKDAERAWVKIKMDDSLLKRIMDALEQHKLSEQWIKDGGKYIPYPATWLNKEKWNDELKIAVPKTATQNKYAGL